MEIILLYSSLSLLIFVIVFHFLSKSRAHSHLPPSPPALPLIGHLHLLKQPLHRTFQDLSQKLGPIFSLRIGSRRIVVVSSPSAVEECFTKNDLVLGNRPPVVTSKYLGYNCTTVFTSPYGDHWRNLRRLMALEVFSTVRLKNFLSVRQDEIKLLLANLYQNSSSINGFARVELHSKFKELTFNIITRMITGKRYHGEDLAGYEEKAKEFRELATEVIEIIDSSYPGDFFPVLLWIDYQNFEKKVDGIHRRMDAFIQGLIDEHRRDDDGTKNSMIDHLLSLQKSQPEYYTDVLIRGLVLDITIAGTDATAVTMEWVMSLLLNHPEVLKKAKVEMATHVSQDRLIDECDLPNLHYLQAIISETLRLFPAAPLLVPRMSSSDCKIGGYDVSRGTTLMVNAWAIHRDSKVWDDPDSFKPERFEVGEVRDGQKLIPFGIGRRSCAGYGLAQRIMGLTLGSLIQCFDWKRVTEKTIDLTEGKGIVMPKLEPLEAMCKACNIMNKVFSGDEHD